VVTRIDLRGIRLEMECFEVLLIKESFDTPELVRPYVYGVKMMLVMIVVK
jgi:hypothetical protein